MSLGRKQRIDNSAWLEAVATIEEAVSRAELDELTAATVADIKAVTAGKCAAYAWSAGKDSIVLGKLCEAAGVTDSMIGVCDLEYPAFAAWIEEHKPAGCEVINTHQDIDWLVKHQEMLFPKDSAAAGRWFSIVQLGVSVPIAYELAHRKDFPSFQIGGRIVVNRRLLEKWVDCQAGGSGAYEQ